VKSSGTCPKALRITTSSRIRRVHAPWYPAFRAESLSFSAGKHDDQVDALGLIGQLLDKMMACRPPKQGPELKRDGYCGLHEQIGDDVLTL
jgi:hypothetical protein